jgi:ubiquitin carboxyl-terminal hydrolase 9/24
MTINPLLNNPQNNDSNNNNVSNQIITTQPQSMTSINNNNNSNNTNLKENESLLSMTDDLDSSQSKPKEENEDFDDDKFPEDDLQRLEEMVNRTRWIVPVLPKNELENLLDASILFCKKGKDLNNEACQRFYRDSLMISFIKILTDDAVNTWKLDIYKHIYTNSMKAIELCTLKLNDDTFSLFELLAMLFNYQCK